VPDQPAFRSNDRASRRERDEKLPIGEERRTREASPRDCDEMLVGDRAIAVLARSQRGVVTTAQLAAAGLGKNAVAHRVANGRLTRMLRGVYRVGPVQAPYAPEMAALLATCGALSHHSAATVSGIRPPHDGPVHVTVARGARNRQGLRVHRSASFTAVVHNGLKLTPAARTLEDLAPMLSQSELERAAEEAVIRGLLTAREVPRRCAAFAAPGLTRSEAERRLQRLIRAAKLPRPVTNVKVAGWEVDVFWPAARLVVEVDGYAYHGNRAAFERDRRKDAALVGAGYTVIRVTWRQIEEEPLAVVALLARLLGREAGVGSRPA
jgi:very-short-patch-repair endonuclease